MLAKIILIAIGLAISFPSILFIMEKNLTQGLLTLGGFILIIIGVGIKTE